MNVIHISAECYPIAKVGGLADVVGSLPKYQENAGVKASVLMPFYNYRFTQKNEFKTIATGEVSLGEKTYAYKVLTLKKNSLAVEVIFIDIPELLFKDYVYSDDDPERFMAFQIAALDWILSLKQKPSIIHCHDHHTGLIPFMLQECYKYKSLNRIPTVLSIHNAQYQGWFSHEFIHYLPAFDISRNGLLDWNGAINPLAAGIKCAWRVTTVSESYMKELQKDANGLERLLSHEKDKCVGILNGIDTSVWNPETDDMLTKNYTSNNVQTGKTANKKWLCKEFGFSLSKPLFSFIGRLVYEKSADLLPEVIDSILTEKNCSILILGSGDQAIEQQLEELKLKHPSNYNKCIGYNEELSHRIYAGSDFLLMPSRIEPCGLNQLYAMRYGTIPIVHSTGGLKDTVIDVKDNGFGFRFEHVNVENCRKTIQRAITYYKEVPNLKNIRKTMMHIDHSWDASAKKYNDLYKSLKTN